MHKPEQLTMRFILPKKILHTVKRGLSFMKITGVAVLASSLWLGACNDQGSTAQNLDVASTETTSTEETNKLAEKVVETKTSEPLDAQALKRLGELTFIKCRSCHSLGKDEAHRVGPNLNGIFGATAGTKEGYNYSDALAKSGIVWDKSTIGAWLVSPATLVAGNKMAFIGISDSQELGALLDYLSENTK